MFRFERLRVWHKAVELYDVIDDVAQQLRSRPHFFLADQLRRAALSVASNIAEGTGRETNRDAQHFFTVAKGSAFEALSISTICHRRGLISPDRFQEIYGRVEDISKMLSGLKRRSGEAKAESLDGAMV